MAIELHILMGLPGSGKSTFAEELREKLRTKCKREHSAIILSVDELKNKSPYGATLGENIRRELSWRMYNETKHIIVDGPIFTNEDLYQMIKETSACFRKEKVDVTVYHWNKDRETCLKNDGGRRELLSATTILYAPYEEVDIDWLRKQLEKSNLREIKVIKKKVVLKEGWERYFRHMTSVSHDKKLRSKQWCAGGSCGNCWDNHLRTVDAEAPVDFDELDELLEKVAPNTTFLHYKKIRKQCVNTEEYYERDYYGGGVTYVNWVCDLEKLYKLLEAQGYISEE